VSQHDIGRKFGPRFGPRFERAVAAIDAANAHDPSSLSHGGRAHPKELLHGELATRWVCELDSEPGEALLLAARAHHLRRWQLPRSEYPEGRVGYHRWRRELQERHAREAGAILEAAGYDAAIALRVGEIVRKRGLGRDPEVQTFEDALCLVFLETQLADFAARHPEDQVVDILAKSLGKMSEHGRAVAGQIALRDPERALVARAVAALSEARTVRAPG
jgi:hypothetical protein